MGRPGWVASTSVLVYLGFTQPVGCGRGGAKQPGPAAAMSALPPASPTAPRPTAGYTYRGLPMGREWVTGGHQVHSRARQEGENLEKHRLNMELDLRSLFGLLCKDLLIG
jgi:hypothetical protein